MSMIRRSQYAQIPHVRVIRIRANSCLATSRINKNLLKDDPIKIQYNSRQRSHPPDRAIHRDSHTSSLDQDIHKIRWHGSRYHHQFLVPMTIDISNIQIIHSLDKWETSQGCQQRSADVAEVA